MADPKSIQPEVADSVRAIVPFQPLVEVLELAEAGGCLCVVCGDAIPETDDAPPPSLVAYWAPTSFSLGLAHPACLSSQVIEVSSAEHHPEQALDVFHGTRWYFVVRDSEPQAVLAISPAESDRSADLFVQLLRSQGFAAVDQRLEELTMPRVSAFRVLATDGGVAILAADDEIFALPEPDVVGWRELASDQGEVVLLYGSLGLEDPSLEELDEAMLTREVLAATVAYAAA